jgi:excinuclease ABC subunit A
VLQSLVDKGNTVITIEHNLDVIKSADWVIDMGPEGGSGGGTVLAVGTPEHIAEVPESHTGVFLREILEAQDARVGKERSVGARTVDESTLGSLKRGSGSGTKKAADTQKAGAR